MICSRCDQDKPDSAFSKRRRVCKRCCCELEKIRCNGPKRSEIIQKKREYTKRVRREHRASYNAKKRARYKNRIDHFRKKSVEYARRSALRHPESNIKRSWRRNGIPLPTRPRPLTCECCGGPPGRVALNNDHDHVTGASRGWLCWECNSAIGRLGDNAEGVIRALDYLLRAGS